MGSSDERLRSEEHTSELQSHVNLVCRLLLEKMNFLLPTFLFYYAQDSPILSAKFPAPPHPSNPHIRRSSHSQPISAVNIFFLNNAAPPEIPPFPSPSPFPI